MRRTNQGLATVAQQKAGNDLDNRQRVSLAVICLKNAVQSIAKRLQCQIIGKLIAHSNKIDKKIAKLNYIVFFAQYVLKRRKQTAFDKFKRARLQSYHLSKALNNLALNYKRISKNNIKFALQKLRPSIINPAIMAMSSYSVKSSSQGKPIRQSIRSSRFSEQSNILSVSQDSVASSKVLVFEDNLNYSQAQILSIRRQNQQLKKMTLSEQARECLMKMQRFDRYIFPMESQRILKEPIANELKRLQKIKNEYKQMRVKFYDNQITITCLFNHIRLVCELNREQTEGGNALKTKNSQLQKKMQDMIVQHRKEINQLKRKLMFIDFGSNKGSRQSSVDVSQQKSQSKSKDSNAFTNQENTTFNILLSALQAKRFKDAKREIQHFIKKTNKKEFVMLLKQIIGIIQDLETTAETQKNNEKDKNQLLSAITLFDKNLRTDKLDELQKIKNKVKNMQGMNQFYALSQTTINLFEELKKLKKKDSASLEKDLKSAQNTRNKKNIQTQNEQLKKQIKMLQSKYDQLQGQRNKLSQTIKKTQNQRPNIPRKPTSIQKDSNDSSKNQENIQKYQQNETALQRKIDNLQKQITQITQRNKVLQQNLQNKIKTLQTDLQNRISNENALKIKSKELEDGLKYSQAIKTKRSVKQIYQRQINEFKRVYPQSIFLQYFQSMQREDSSNLSMLNQVKSIATLFSGNGWRRKQNMLITLEGQIYVFLNQIIELLLSLSRFKEEGEKSNTIIGKQLQNIKKRQSVANDQNNKIKQELAKIREENVNLKQSSPTRLEKRVSTSLPKQNNTDNQSKLTQINVLKIRVKELEDGLKYYQAIKAKKEQKLNYNRQINEFRRLYPQSIFIQIFENITKQEAFTNILTTQLKNISQMFIDNSWKRKQNVLLKEDSEVNTLINQIINILLSLSKEKEEAAKVTRQTSKELKEMELLKKSVVAFSQQNAKLKQELAKLKANRSEQSSPDQMEKIQITSTNLEKQLNQQKSQNQKLNTSIAKLKAQLQKLKVDSLKTNKPVVNNQAKLQQKLKQCQAQIASRNQLQKQTKLKLKQYDDAIRYYQIIKQKKMQGQIYQREINEFRRYYPQSIYLQLFQGLVKEEQAWISTTNQLYSIATVFADNSWKRKQILQIQGENKIIIYINQIVELLYTVYREREEISKTNTQLSRQVQIYKKKEYNLNQQNEKWKIEIGKAKEEINKFKAQNNKVKLELAAAQKYMETNSKPASPPKIQKSNSYSDKQINQLKSQNEELKQSLALKSQQCIALSDSIQKMKKQFYNLQRTIKQSQSLKGNVDSNISVLENTIEQLKFWRLQAQQRQKRQLQQIKQQKNQIDLMNHKLNEYQFQISSSEEKVANYKYLLDKVKSERDNLRLIVQENKEDLEEHIELTEEDKRLNQEQIISLKYSYESTQMEIRKIQMEVERLLQERDSFSQQKTDIERKYKEQIQLREHQVKEMKLVMQQKERSCNELQNRVQSMNSTFKNQMMTKESQKQYLTKTLTLREEEINQIRTRLTQQTSQFKLRYQSITRQLQQIKRQYQQQRIIFKQRISQFTNIQYQTIHPNIALDDQQKLQLRKQLDLVNQELAVSVRNNENQKRQLRKYIQKLTSQAQMQIVMINQEKKILREDIERARNQEYQINHQKIRKLRQDIQVLREENQRLTSIIDSNQTSFNQLIKEHKDMYQKIIDLEQENREMVKEIGISRKEKEDLMRRLQPLQDKLTEFQRKIAQAMQEKALNEEQYMRSSQQKVNDLQIMINHLNEEKHILSNKNMEQGKQLVEMQREIIRMESEINNFRQRQVYNTQLTASNIQRSQVEESSNRYGKYLEEKVKDLETEIKVASEKQRELINKIQRFMKNINDLQREKMEEQSMRRDRQMQLTLIQSNFQKQQLFLMQKIKKTDEIISQKQKQTQFWRSQSIVLKQQISELQVKVISFEDNRISSNSQNDYLKIQIQQLMKERSQFITKMEQNQRMAMQNKLLLTKINNSQQDNRSLQLRISQHQNEIVKLRRQNQAKSSEQSDQLCLGDRSMIKQKQEEISWLRKQISVRDQEVHRLRSVEIDLQTEIKRREQKIFRMDQIEQRNIRQIQSHQESKRQIVRMQEFYTAELNCSKIREEETAKKNTQIIVKISQLQQQYTRLAQQNQRPAQQPKHDHNFLKSLAQQLDENYQVNDQEEETEMNILLKISQQISDLIDSNHQLKNKCEQLQNQIYENHAEDCQSQFVRSLNDMMTELLHYLTREQIVNPQQIGLRGQGLISSSRIKSCDRYIDDVGLFFRDLLVKMSRDKQQAHSKFSSIIKDITSSLQDYFRTNNRQYLIRLRNLLKQSM